MIVNQLIRVTVSSIFRLLIRLLLRSLVRLLIRWLIRLLIQSLTPSLTPNPPYQPLGCSYRCIYIYIFIIITCFVRNHVQCHVALVWSDDFVRRCIVVQRDGQTRQSTRQSNPSRFDTCRIVALVDWRLLSRPGTFYSARATGVTKLAM